MVPRLVLLLSLASALSAGGCKHERKYDDAPIGRDDRKKKAPEVPETFDLDSVCSQLVDLPGPAIDAPLAPDLREMCRKGLAAMQKDRPREYECRCRCIKGAGDLLAVERCVRFCTADDPVRVCDHVVGVELSTNDAGVLETAHDDCVADLKKLHDTDLGRWSCTVRCLVAATAKDDALACAGKCGGATAPKGDAGVDGGAYDAGMPKPPVPYPPPFDIVE